MLHPNQEYEFLQRGFSPMDPEIPPQRTPRKYTVGTCTLTVMLLNWWGPGSLPNPIRPSLPVIHTDTSTYAKIWAAAKGLEVACPDRGSGGWCVVGTLAIYLRLLFLFLMVWGEGGGERGRLFLEGG